jgi:hypothetical protein
MNGKNEHSTLFIRKILLIGIFLFTPFLFHQADPEMTRTSDGKNGIEQIMEVCHHAALVPVVSNFLQTKLFVVNTFAKLSSGFDRLAFFYTTSNVEPSLRLCHQRFIRIKPTILSILCSHYPAGPDGKEMPQAS